MGWNDTTWSGGNDSRFRILDPAPDLSYQISGGGFVNGTSRALLLTTDPEPILPGLLASRTIPAQNTTLYFSFLVRPIAIGTGSDSIDIQLRSDSTLLARIALQPDGGQSSLLIKLPSDGASGGGTSGGGSGTVTSMYAPETYFIVARLSWPMPNQIRLDTGINPSFSGAPGFSQSRTRNLSGPLNLNSIGFGISSADTGGPTTTVMIDEFRIGYTWADVVLPGPPNPLVPSVAIDRAVKLRWQSEMGKNYQPQYSYNFNSWFNLGPVIAGDGTIKHIFDSAYPDAEKFYRIQIQSP